MSSTRPVTIDKLAQVITGEAIPDRNVLREAFRTGILQKQPLAEAMNCNPAHVISLWEHKNAKRIQDALRSCLPVA